MANVIVTSVGSTLSQNPALVARDTHRSAKCLTAQERRILLARTPFQTGAKFVFALLVIVTGLLVIFYRGEIFSTISAQIPLVLTTGLILGLFYGHFTELQHELLHGHGFRSERINRALGFICGLFMFSSYSHYRHHHLAHHRHLGTERNSEFFAYPNRGLDGPLKLACAALDPSRFGRIARSMMNGLLSRPAADIDDSVVARRVSNEYAAYAVILAVAAIYTIATGDITVVLAWWLPLLLVAEPTHYLIELPEHFGLDAHGSRNVRENTRSIEANLIARWFTNGNNLHTTHHMMAGVPMSRCHKLHTAIRDDLAVVEPSYLTFYTRVVSGELKPFVNGRPTVNA